MKKHKDYKEVDWPKLMLVMGDLTKEFEQFYLNVYHWTQWEGREEQDRGHSWIIHVLPGYGTVDIADWEDKYLPVLQRICGEYDLTMRFSCFMDDFAIMLSDTRDEEEDDA